MRQRLGSGRHVAALLRGGAFAALLAGADLAAQGVRPVGTKAAARGEAVWLIVRPRVGDTLWLQMDQTIEMSGRRSDAPTRTAPPMIERKRSGSAAARRPDYGPRQDRARTQVTKLQLFAHSLVESSTLAVTTLLATTDSMAMSAGTALEPGKPQRVGLPAEGRQVRVRVTPDGAMQVNDPPGAMELGVTLASMPGMLPDRAVAVGDRWERDIILPSVPVSGFRADGVVRARFRLDSLTHAGRDAWISMEGTLERDGGAREMPAGTRMITAGTMSGILVVDRHRAWIVDARTTIEVQSEVAPGPAGPATPMLLDMRILQHMRVK